MSAVLVTGADGFVGRWAVRLLLASGYEVVGAVHPSDLGPKGVPRTEALTEEEKRAARWLPLELGDLAEVQRAAGCGAHAVLHLAAVSSGADALQDPGAAWAVNAAGTARLLEELARRRAGDSDPLVLVASTAEVYGGAVRRPLAETDPPSPASPYAASKAAAELAATEIAARTGLKVVISRAFPHTGPGQDERFVAPAFARRLRGAKQAGARVVKVGRLDLVRDLLDVRDVVAAYIALVERGVPGQTYNVASGRTVSLEELFDRLAAIIGVAAIPETDPELVRPNDLAHLVGDPAKIQGATGWKARIPLEETLRDLVHAQAD